MSRRHLAVLVCCLSAAPLVTPCKGSPFKVIADLAPKSTGDRPAATIIRECTEVLTRREQEKPHAVIQALWARGCAYLRVRDPGRAIGDFDALCNLDAKKPMFRALRALALADLGKMEEAEQQALEAVLMDPEIPVHHVVLGNIDVAQGKWRHAIADATSASHFDKKLPSALYLRGWAAHGEGDYEESLACLNKFLEEHVSKSLRDPDHPYWIRGSAYLGLCRHREALNSFSTARKLNPSSAMVAEGICLTYLEMQQWHMAAKAAVELAAIIPNEARTHQACAVLHARLGKKKEAEASLRKAQDLLPPAEKDADALPNFNAYAAMTYFHLGEYQEAARLLDDAFNAGVIADLGWWVKCRMLASCPDAKYRDGRASLKIATEMLDEEKRIQRIEQHQFAIYALLADAYAECGDFVSALASVRKAIEIAGDREVGELRDRIKLFENKTPYRHAVRSD